MSARLAEVEDDRDAIAWERPGGLKNMQASGGRSGAAAKAASRGFVRGVFSGALRDTGRDR